MVKNRNIVLLFIMQTQACLNEGDGNSQRTAKVLLELNVKNFDSKPWYFILTFIEAAKVLEIERIELPVDVNIIKNNR